MRKPVRTSGTSGCDRAACSEARRGGVSVPYEVRLVFRPERPTGTIVDSAPPEVGHEGFRSQRAKPSEENPMQHSSVCARVQAVCRRLPNRRSFRVHKDGDVARQRVESTMPRTVRCTRTASCFRSARPYMLRRSMGCPLISAYYLEMGGELRPLCHALCRPRQPPGGQVRPVADPCGSAFGWLAACLRTRRGWMGAG